MYFERDEGLRARARRARAQQLQSLLREHLQLEVAVEDDPLEIDGMTFTCRGSSAFSWLALLADCPVCGTAQATTSMSIRDYGDLEAAIREIERREQSPCVPCARRWKEHAGPAAMLSGLAFPN